VMSIQARSSSKGLSPFIYSINKIKLNESTVIPN